MIDVVNWINIGKYFAGVIIGLVLIKVICNYKKKEAKE